MTRIVWGELSNRLYETGVDRGVFYPQGSTGVPWSGLIAVAEAPSGSDIIESHYDGNKFQQQRRSGSFSARISAYTYPQEFESYDGLDSAGYTQRNRKMFNFSYRTLLANGENSNPAYLIHLVYNAVATPLTREFSSVGPNSQVTAFEWQLETVPEIFPTGEMSAHLVIDSRVTYPWAMSALEDILYGSAVSDSRFPSITEVLNLFENASILRITDNGDGTWTADGPDDVIKMLSPTIFEITWPSALYIDTDSYTISSL